MPLAKRKKMRWPRAVRPLLLLALLGASVSHGAIISLGDDDFDDFVGKLPDEALLLVDFFKVGRHPSILPPLCSACV